MKRFIVDNKLVIPENEINNVYIWTKISRSQEVLLSSESYYKLMKQSFETDVKRVINVLKNKLPSVSLDTYKFCDYITFIANKSKFFNDTNCFVYMNNLEMLNSLACFLAHTMNKYLPETDTLSSLIINKIDEPDRFTKLMENEFIILKIYAPLPEHKYKQAILDMMLTRRCKPGLNTLIYTMNTGLLIGDDLITKERAVDNRLVDLSPLVPLFNQRRSATYQSLLKTWFEMTKVNLDSFVYSKKEPKINTRQVSR